MDKSLTLKEIAQKLRVSERTVLRYIEAGKLKASKIDSGGLKRKIWKNL